MKKKEKKSYVFTFPNCNLVDVKTLFLTFNMNHLDNQTKKISVIDLRGKFDKP